MQRLHGKLKPAHGLIASLSVRASTAVSSAGRLVGGNLDVACALGRAGTVAIKREGDGASPRGRHAVLFGFYRADRFGVRPRSALTLAPLRPSDGWCDAPAHPAYNRRVRLPFAASREELWRDDGLYDVVLVLDWNYRLRRRGRGSAIFFHLGGGRPTAGCVAVSRGDMLKILARLAPGAVLAIG